MVLNVIILLRLILFSASNEEASCISNRARSFIDHENRPFNRIIKAISINSHHLLSNIFGELTLLIRIGTALQDDGICITFFHKNMMFSSFDQNNRRRRIGVERSSNFRNRTISPSGFGFNIAHSYQRR
jgi:hypothetical protein